MNTMHRNAICRLTLLMSITLGLTSCGMQDDWDAAAAEVTAGAAAPIGERDAAAVSPAGAVAPSWQEAANMTYSGIFGEAIVLQDGAWEGTPYVEGGSSAPRVGLAEDFILTGNIDGDTAPEAVVLLWSSGGGSGTFDYLAVLDRDADGAVINRGIAPLGDRVRVRSAVIEDQHIVVRTVQAGPGDAACCPGQKMRRTFVLEGDTMSETKSEDEGRLSLNDVTGEWRLVRFGAEEDVPSDVEITLQFADGRVAGRAACNRYSGGVTEGASPGDVSLTGALAVTRMMCPPPLMEWEQRYLGALQGLTKYSFMTGSLVLSCRNGDEFTLLRFAPVD